MTMEVTADRMEDIQEELKSWSDKMRATKQEIQSFAGKLEFVAKCCKPGRCFMARILTILKTLKRQTHRAYLNQEFRKDILWWVHFLPHFNSTSIIKTLPWSEPYRILATDTCLKGGGGTFNKRYFWFEFPQEFLDMEEITSISQLEAITVIVALKLWCTMMQGYKLVIKCDNEATVSVLNSGRASDSFLQKCARELTFLACKHEFEIRAVHIPGVENRLPDLLSRVCLDVGSMNRFLDAIDSSWVQDVMDVEGLKFSCPW